MIKGELFSSLELLNLKTPIFLTGCNVKVPNESLPDYRQFSTGISCNYSLVYLNSGIHYSKTKPGMFGFDKL